MLPHPSLPASEHASLPSPAIDIWMRQAKRQYADGRTSSRRAMIARRFSSKRARSSVVEVAVARAGDNAKSQENAEAPLKLRIEVFNAEVEKATGSDLESARW